MDIYIYIYIYIRVAFRELHSENYFCARIDLLRMNKTKLNVYKKVLHEVCEKFNEAEEFINKKIEETGCQEMLLVKHIIYFVYERLCFVVNF